MNTELLVGFLVVLTPIAVIVGIVASYLGAKMKFGSEYMAVVSEFQWKCVKGVALLGLYFILAYADGGWSKITGGVALSAAAFTFFTLAVYELACGISLNHRYSVSRKRVQFLVRLLIIGQTVALVTLVLVFQATSVHWSAVVLQSALLIASIFSFYAVGSLVNLMKIGHVPHGRDANTEVAKE